MFVYHVQRWTFFSLAFAAELLVVPEARASLALAVAPGLLKVKVSPRTLNSKFMIGRVWSFATDLLDRK